MIDMLLFPVARKGVQWFGNAAKYPLFQDMGGLFAWQSEILGKGSGFPSRCSAENEDNIMEGSLCPWLVCRVSSSRCGLHS